MSIFNCLFNHTIGLHKRNSIDNFGNITYSPPLEDHPIEVKCRIEWRYKEIINKDGNKITSEATIFTNTKLEPLDIVISEGKSYVVKACKNIDGLIGELDHFEVYI